MDESWRMRMGMASIDPAIIPGRRSAGDTSRRNVFADNECSLDPEDFSDVFGGPPRSVLSRQFSSAGDFTSVPTFFYEEIFQHPNREGVMNPRRRGPGRLPEFRIPASIGGRKDNEEEFYSDIFGDLRRSRSRSQSKTNSVSKSNSSSVLSSEGLSPFRPAIVEDDVSFFASKLRPLNVTSKWNSTATTHEVRQIPQEVPDFPFNRFPSYAGKQFSENEQLENYRISHSGSSRRVSSPETTELGPNSRCSIKVSVEDLLLNSPSSVASVVCHDQMTKTGTYKDQATQEQSMNQEGEEDDDDDEVMSSYVIEINFDNRERAGEALGIDEAIAWAKEKCQGLGSEKEWSMEKHEEQVAKGLQERPSANHSPEGKIRGSASTQPQLYKKPTEEQKEQLERDMELELLDEDVRLWSAGKEANIRLLLSTLHHILWPTSGWNSMPSSNLLESADVKKAYQKARLCLHPDKLQQRGATFPQRYIAEKAFPILQDAWAAFISQDAFLSKT